MKFLKEQFHEEGNGRIRSDQLPNPITCDCDLHNMVHSTTHHRSSHHPYNHHNPFPPQINTIINHHL